MTAPTCQNCRHWSNPSDRKFGFCELSRMSNGVPVHKESLCYADDCEEFGAILLTLPTFSCNQHQPREE
jgi:hypothetical protein